MGKQFWSQIAVLLLAVVLCLYFWLGYWAVAAILFGGVVLAVVIAIRRRSTKAIESQGVAKPSSVRVEKSRDEVIAERRRAQGRNFFAAAEQIVKMRTDLQRTVERMLDWYSDYLKSNGVYHTELYDYMLQRIKERQQSAKASYLKRELNISKSIIRSLMRGYSAEQILERLDEYDS